MFIYIAFNYKMCPEFYIFLFFSVFPPISSKEILPGFGEYNGIIFTGISGNENDWQFLDITNYNFTFPERLPHWIGDRLRYNSMVIRTFPTEINEFKENTEYTKNISLEMETSCGFSKSAFDKTDLVTLTLMEKQDKGSIIIKTIQIDPLSVDFYSPKLTMKQFKMLAENEIKKRAEFCNELCKKNKDSALDEQYLEICPNNTCTCNERIEDAARSYAEMDKFVKIMKYLELFQERSSNCLLPLYWVRYKPRIVVELDNKTASMFPNLNNNHYFVASFTDTKRRKSAALILKGYKII